MNADQLIGIMFCRHNGQMDICKPRVAIATENFFRNYFKKNQINYLPKFKKSMSFKTHSILSSLWVVTGVFVIIPVLSMFHNKDLMKVVADITWLLISGSLKVHKMYIFVQFGNSLVKESENHT